MGDGFWVTGGGCLGTRAVSWGASIGSSGEAVGLVWLLPTRGITLGLGLSADREVGTDGVPSCYREELIIATIIYGKFRHM